VQDWSLIVVYEFEHPDVLIFEHLLHEYLFAQVASFVHQYVVIFGCLLIYSVVQFALLSYSRLWLWLCFRYFVRHELEGVYAHGMKMFVLD
jgi:hypothetical protein